MPPESDGGIHRDLSRLYVEIMGNSGSRRTSPVRGPDDKYDPYPWLNGERTYNDRGHMVVKFNSPDGVIAAKVGPEGGNLKTEAFLLKYAREVADMKVPRFRGLEYYEGHTIMKTDFDPGQPLDKVWNKLSNQNRASIKEELKKQIRLMRQCKSHHHGCVNQHGEHDSKIPIPDPYNPCRLFSRSRPCTDEATFDNNKIEMVKKRGPENVGLGLAKKLEPMLPELSKEYTDRFVLTHGDLAACNILVQDINKNGLKNSRPFYSISSIIDWQYSGFFPEYMEYALERKRVGGGQWQSFMCGLLKEMGLDCSQNRMKFEQLVQDRL